MARSAARPPSAWDRDGTERDLNTIPGATVVWKAPNRMDQGHFRVTFPRWKTAILIISGVETVDYETRQPTVGLAREVTITPAISKFGKDIPPVYIRHNLATPAAVKAAVEKWAACYLKKFPVQPPRGPTVRQVLNHVYYGAPLKDEY